MSTMPIEPSSRRQQILAFIRERIAAGQPPSLAEIAEAFGFASRNAAQKHVLALAEAGLIELAPRQKRGIRLPGAKRPDVVALPVLGRVAAGAPIGPDPGQDLEFWLDGRLFAHRPDYLLRVKGDSMIDDGILDGDLVGVRRTPEARDGEVVVARVDGEMTIKRLRREPDRIRLLPRNPAYAPIVVAPGQDFAIEGIYCGLVRRD
ncbi:MAG: repressor LexA [Xanthomonadales bacterium]|nr:repressor LexA [Xanthomonadales bacterium]